MTDRYDFPAQFTRFPGARCETEGPYSGARFLHDVLEPAHKASRPTRIVLTGAMGFSTGFLDGAFGEFAHRHSVARFDELFEIEVDDDPGLDEEIRGYLVRGEADTSD